MRGDGASSMATAGCGGLSLVGLLVSIGLVVWLGSKALPDSDSSAKERSSSSGAVTEPDESHALDVSLDPADDLDENTPIVVMVEGLDAGATFSVATCLRRRGAGHRLRCPLRRSVGSPNDRRREGTCHCSLPTGARDHRGRTAFRLRVR